MPTSMTISGSAWTGDDGLRSVAGAPTIDSFRYFGNSVALSATHALIGISAQTITPLLVALLSQQLW